MMARLFQDTYSLIQDTSSMSITIESLITSYGIDYPEFKLRVAASMGVIAGSAALACYLSQEGQDPGFTPNDIDIFLPGGSWGHDESDVTDIVTLLKTYGFTLDEYSQSEDYQCFSDIQSISTLIKGNNKIQIIVLTCMDVIDYIAVDFDLTACMCWWNLHTDRFEAIHPLLTKRKEIYQVRTVHDSSKDEKRAARIQKYIDRGFKLVDPPCQILQTRDTREDLTSKKFEGITVCDIFTLEDMDFKAFLEVSEYNIVIKTGKESYHAFDRRALTDYMLRKVVCINPRVTDVFETPFNQCISRGGVEMLQYADFSIFELRHDRSVETDKGVKSLFSIYCYSVKEWVEDRAVLYQSCPAAPIVTAAEELEAARAAAAAQGWEAAHAAARAAHARMIRLNEGILAIPF